MANTSSAKKQIRAQKRKLGQNQNLRHAFRDARKAVKSEAGKASTKDLDALVSKFHKAIDKAAKVNIVHKNTAARYKSRLAAMVTKASAK